MPALWIAQSTVTDPESYARYTELAGPIVARHGGTILARGGRSLQLEGQGRPRNVVVRFPSLEAAEACYKSPDYQQALAHAIDASERELVLVETSE